MDSYYCPCCKQITDHVQAPPHPADLFFVFECARCNALHDRRRPMSEIDMEQFHANRMVFDNEEAQW